RSDFADMFELRGSRFVRRGRITTDWHEATQCLRTEYVNEDFQRCVAVSVRAKDKARYANGRLTLELDLKRGEKWHACLLYTLEDGGKRFEAPEACLDHAGESRPARDLQAWRQSATKLQSVNEEFYRLYHQAVDDLAALRVPVERDGVVNVLPAAGLPWYVALFGRDTMIVSLQTTMLSTELAAGALEILGNWQATERDDFRDAEPGKILHEMRRGELAHFHLVPHTPYYGSADATPLYLILLHAAWLWTGDAALIERHLPVAERCLSWIDEFGDRDGDGFQEYQTRSPKGLENQSWKDSWDGVRNPDGSLVKLPRALCELQGYVYAGWLGMAEIFDARGHKERAAALRAKADSLHRKFNEAFWNEEQGTYALALDGDKKPAMSVASNAGHLLWTGIVPPDRAERVVQRLLAPDMFSGWGVRTLSAQHCAFNPFSYHNGSVWPHDNGIIALGMKRYGFTEAVGRVARAVSGAGAFFSLHQLPELYAGIAREGETFPVQYLGVCVPQAWASGSVMALTRAILGLQPDAPNRVLYVDPELPRWLPELRLTDLTVGDQDFDLHFRRVGDETVVEVLRGDATAVRRSGDGRGGLRP
ncbi:MAG: amylo-alpha-1,6-glucosidase, partial [Acetobacteraceae bacterium]|nr:amylo-alpha-1,6-glucosidase [Acetobacteraceae bacterium]